MRGSSVLLVLNVKIIILLAPALAVYYDNRDKLIGAVMRKNYNQVRSLLQNDIVNFNAVDDCRGTALHWAARLGTETTTRLILNNGGDVQLENKDAYGDTPLRTAVLWGNNAVVPTLIGKGAKINVTDMNGETVVHMAAREGSSILEYLLQQGGDAHLKNAAGKSPLDVALEYGNDEGARLVRHYGEEMGAGTPEHDTGLQAHDQRAVSHG